MITSRLLERHKSLQAEYDKGIRDPRRKTIVEAFLKQLECDIVAIGFDQADRDKYLPQEIEKSIDK